MSNYQKCSECGTKVRRTLNMCPVCLPVKKAQAPTIHLLEAIHAAREGDATGCHAKGTKRVAVKEEEVTCRCCKRWYWSQGLQVAPHVLKELTAAK